MRIASLLPSATEILFALGLEDQVVGVTHACDYPPAARSKPVVVRSELDDARLSSAEIDRRVREALREGRSLYRIDQDALERLQPQLLVTQEVCDICAVNFDQVRTVGEVLDPPPRIVSLNPSRLADVFADIRRVADAAGVPDRGERLVAALTARVERVRKAACSVNERPTVACVEWLDPPFVAGHWVPEMVSLAGGRDALGEPGRPSFRTDWDMIAQADPDVIVLMPCGYDVRRTRASLDEVARRPEWRELRAVREGRVYAVDANRYFSRPGPRLVDGVEILARILHPQCFADPGVSPDDAVHLLGDAGTGPSAAKTR